MKIVADENIPFVREAFSGLGDVTLAHGRFIPDLTDTDVLIVRSITPVNAKLLHGTSVKFVGTSTIGFDHIDRDYLALARIGFASAPGSNSNSVAEYVVAALLVHARDCNIRLDGKSIAVIGVGNVGSKVVRKCQALGMTVLKNDPPLAEKTGDPSFLQLNDVLNADFITLHVPLTKMGKYPTFHMVDCGFLENMNGVLINTSRGSVVDESALFQSLGKNVPAAILDVWENEPHVNAALAGRVRGTPHIAGYSFDGKVNGTQMMYDAVCDFFGLKKEWRAADFLPPGGKVHCSGDTDEELVRDAVLQVYDIERDFREFTERLNEFDRLRKAYPRRRDFHTAIVTFADEKKAVGRLSGIGFNIR